MESGTTDLALSSHNAAGLADVNVTSTALSQAKSSLCIIGTTLPAKTSCKTHRVSIQACNCTRFPQRSPPVMSANPLLERMSQSHHPPPCRIMQCSSCSVQSREAQLHSLFAQHYYPKSGIERALTHRIQRLSRHIFQDKSAQEV